MTEELCKSEVEKNIINVDLGKPLTLPLSILNQSCDFRKKWEETFNAWHEDEIAKEVRERIRKYNQKPEVKERNRKYKRKYNQKPEVKEHHREYNQKPEVKEYHRKYKRKYNQKPEVKERNRKYNRKRNNIPKSRWRVK